MILELTLEKDLKNGKVLNKEAAYQPDERVRARITQVLKDFGIADQIRNKPYLEFNGMSLIDRMNLDQMSWSQFVDTPTEDPAQAWRSRAFRPIVRNKIITIAAHITAAIIYPKIYAQNENDQEDKDAAAVMRDLMEWVAERSNYDRTFLYAVIGALVNPAAIIHTEYTEKFREIKEMKADGTWDIKEVLDELFSGFQDCIVPCDELWIGDFYEHNIQKQPFLIWRKVIDYTTALAKYGDNENFKEYVRPGVQFLYSDDQNLFYESWDDSLQGRLVEEVVYYNRTGDLMLTFVNGVLLDDPDQPNPRKDKSYPFAKTGYELLDDGRCFYYKSLAFKLQPDEEVVNTAYRMLADGSYIQAMPPAVVFGNEEIGSAVIAPGMVTTIDNSTNPNASFQTIQTNNNLGAMYNLLEKVESSISESSSDVMQTGQTPGGTQTAFEISRVEQNARVMLGLFGKMIGFMVKDFGYLRVSDILQFMTVGDVMDIENPAGRLKFKNFILPEQTEDGKTKTKQIEFDADLPLESTEQDNLDRSMELYQKEHDLGNNVKLIKVNPTLFRKLKFQVAISPEAMMPKNEALEKALQLEEYGLAMGNPLTNKEAITRDLLLGSYKKTKDDPEKYMVSQEAQMGGVGLPPGMQPGAAVMGTQPGGGEQVKQLAQAL